MQTFGVIGNPVSQSLSPVLHSMAYEATGFDGSYGRFLVLPDELKNVPMAMKALGISGINVTVPYKQEIIPFLDALSDEAEAIGAVNTVKLLEDGRLMGYNTDCRGFYQSLLSAGIEISGRTFAVCGAGGAGKAVCHALSQGGAAKVVTVSTDPQKGISYEKLETLGGMDVIVNCTPLGMPPKSGEMPVKPEVFKSFGAAVDLIYNPAETLFLKTARERGLKTLNGLSMLVFQGLSAFTIWTGITPPITLAEKIKEKLACVLEEKRV